MGEPKNELNVTSLRAEALGEPGERTFRIVANGDGSSATIWIEKEQLFQLSLAIQQLIETLQEQEGASNASVQTLKPASPTHLDFKAEKLGLGHDDGKRLFNIDAHDPDDEDDDSATIRVWASREQVSDLAEEGLRVCAAGRPLCPLCGGPIDQTGHSCPRANGHVKVTSL